MPAPRHRAPRRRLPRARRAAVLDPRARPRAAHGSPAAATSTSSSARATRSCVFRLTPLTCGRRSRGGSRSSTSCSTRTSPRRSTTAVPPLASPAGPTTRSSHYRAAGRPRLLRRTRPRRRRSCARSRSTRSASCDRPSTRSTFPTTLVTRPRRLATGDDRRIPRPAVADCARAPTRTGRPRCAHRQPRRHPQARARAHTSRTTSSWPRWVRCATACDRSATLVPHP